MIVDPQTEAHNSEYMSTWCRDMNNRPAKALFVVGVKNDNSPYMLSIPNFPADTLLDCLRKIVKAMEDETFSVKLRTGSGFIPGT